MTPERLQQHIYALQQHHSDRLWKWRQRGYEDYYLKQAWMFEQAIETLRFVKARLEARIIRQAVQS